MADPNAWPVSSHQDDSLSRLQQPLTMASNSTPTDEALQTSFAFHPMAPSSEPAQVRSTNVTVTARQYAVADGMVAVSHAERQPPGSTGAYTSRNTSSSTHPVCFDTCPKPKELNKICQDFQAIVETQTQKIAGLDDRYKRAQQKNTDLENDLRRVQQKSTDLENDLRRVQQKSIDLENDLRRVQQKNTDLEIDLERRQQENDFLATRVADLQDMLASKVTRTGNPGASLIGDAEVQGRWTTLCFSIRQFATQHVDDSRKRAGFISAPRGLTQGEDVVLRERDGCCLLAQAALWSVLVEHVFGNGLRMSRMFWAGKYSEGLRYLCRCLVRSGR